MRRWLTVLGILGLVVAGVGVLAVGWPRDNGGSPAAPPEAPAVRQAYAQPRASAPMSSGPVVEVHNLAGSRGPLVVPNCRLVVIERQEVPALRDGPIHFIATEPEPGEVVPPERQVKVEDRFLATPIRPSEKVAPKEMVAVPGDPSRQYRRVKEGEQLEPGEFIILKEERTLRRLKVGDRVKKGQLLALVDSRLALDDLGVKGARVVAARAERVAAEMTRDEADRRYRRIAPLQGKAFPTEEVDGARLTHERYRYEEVSKAQAIVLSGHELKQAQTILDMHTIRSKIDGVVKAIYKQDGEAVKNLESVLLIQNPNRLRVEALVELQHARQLVEGMPVTVEASRPEKPELVLRGHMQEVTSVAVADDGQGRPLILSGSEDRTARVWDRVDGKQLYTLRFPSAVRAVACARDGKQNLAVAGTAEGAAWLLRGFSSTKEPTLAALGGRHKGPVVCAVFSPDGKLLATGGEDHTIRLWDTSNGELLHLCPTDQGHRGAVTSLHFASNTELVSAGRGDQSVLVWRLGANSLPSRVNEFPRRSGDVADLGVSPDGKRVLFDHGRDLQVLSLATGQIEGVLHNASPAMNFTTMALFSPKDGKLILTASASENRLQLYRSPVGARCAEIRQLVWPTSPATCGAFDPQGRFAVTGMKDRGVLVWQMPSPQEVDQELRATITTVDRSLDSGARQVRIAAEVDNPAGYLVPGDTATLVIEPKK